MQIKPSTGRSPLITGEDSLQDGIFLTPLNGLLFLIRSMTNIKTKTG